MENIINQNINISNINSSFNTDIFKNKKISIPKPLNNVKPFVKWAGGKRQIMKTILKHIPEDFNNYYEPFIVGGSVFLTLTNNDLIKNKAIINDINFELIQTYKCIKNKSCHKQLLMHLEENNEKNTKEWFLKLRSWDRDENYLTKFSQAQRAARFIYMNRVCFNGLYRVNSKNYFNVPYGTYKNPKIVDEENLKNLQKIFRITNIKNTDFAKTLSNAKENDFVYIDPPYISTDNGKEIFNSYSKDKFDVDEQLRLRHLLDKLTKKKVKVLLSNSYCKWIMKNYKKYTIIKIKVNRPIAANAKNRKIDIYNEVLIKNY